MPKDQEGIFKHQCVHPDCGKIIEFDDEPWCFEHSPDEGSSLYGWSARKLLREGVCEIDPKIKQVNIFASGEQAPGEG